MIVTFLPNIYLSNLAPNIMTTCYQKGCKNKATYFIASERLQAVSDEGICRKHYQEAMDKPPR